MAARLSGLTNALRAGEMGAIPSAVVNAFIASDAPLPSGEANPDQGRVSYSQVADYFK